MSYSEIQFPDLNIPESQKDKDWYRDYTLAIVNNTMGGSYDLEYNSIQESFDYYDGIQRDDAFDFLQETEGGDTLPAIWINYNKVRVKVNTFVGELRAKGYDINVRAVNKDAKSSRLEAKFKIQGAMDIMQDMTALQNETGLPSQPTMELPSPEQDIDDFMEFDYKTTSELVIGRVLKYITKKYEWDYQRLSAFRDVVITGRCFTEFKIINGMPVFSRVDPRYMVWDRSAEDDFLKTSSYFGIVSWDTLSDLKSEHNLTKKEIEEIDDEGSAQQRNIMGWSKDPEGNRNVDFKKNGKILVFRGMWKDTKKMKRKKSVDKYGNEHYKKVKENAKGKDIVNKDIVVWRECTVIGGVVVRQNRCIENMVRSVDDITDTHPNICCYVPDYINGRTVSRVDLLKGLQDTKNMIMYNFQLAMARAGAKGFTYDLAQCPDNWEIEDVMKYLKTSGILFVNSKKDGVPMSQGPLREFDMTISQSITHYFNSSAMVDKEMNDIIGMNDLRQGNVQAATATVGVTQAAMNSSNMATASLFDMFRIHSQHIYTHLAGMVKICWTDRDRFAPLIGDVGIDFIKQDVDLTLEELQTL
jgi:hypothetical protein